jgi:hypothetical protein
MEFPNIETQLKREVSMATRKKGTSAVTKAKLSRAASGKRNPFFGKTHSQAWKKQERRRKAGKNNPMFGRKHSPGTLRKIRQAALNRSK